VPTTVVGFDVSTGFPLAGTAVLHEPFVFPPWKAPPPASERPPEELLLAPLEELEPAPELELEPAPELELEPAPELEVEPPPEPELELEEPPPSSPAPLEPPPPELLPHAANTAAPSSAVQTGTLRNRMVIGRLLLPELSLRASPRSRGAVCSTGLHRDAEAHW
jgi:hypothetical protein